MIRTRIVALDYGQKRIGLAISDENKIIASPIGMIQAEKTHDETIQKLLTFLSPYKIEKIIIGNPLHLNGKSSSLSEEIKKFIESLQNKTTIPIVLWDERLSTMQAEKMMQEMTRKKRSQVIDTVSATILLQSFLGY